MTRGGRVRRGPDVSPARIATRSVSVAWAICGSGGRWARWRRRIPPRPSAR